MDLEYWLVRLPFPLRILAAFIGLGFWVLAIAAQAVVSFIEWIWWKIGE